MEPDEGDLGGAGQEEVVGRERVGLFAVGRELPRSDQRLLPDHHRDRDHGGPGRDEVVERVGEQRPLQQHHVAGERVGPLARHLPRPGELRPAAVLEQLDVVLDLEVEGRPLAPCPDRDVGGVVAADRRARPRDRRGEQQQGLQFLVDLGERLAHLFQVHVLLVVLGPQRRPGRLVGSRELLGERLSPGLRLVELALQFPAGLVKAEQFVHVQVDALNPDGRLHGFRVVPDESSVQHGGNATRSGAPHAEDDGDPVRLSSCW